MAGITRLNGTAVAESFYGYQPRWFKIAGTGFDTNVGTVGCNFEKAVRAIENYASIVQLGTVGTGGFVVAVDGTTFDGYNSATSAVTAADALDAIVTAATSISTTVTEVYIGGGTGLVFTNTP
jgi:hypothetical protein